MELCTKQPKATRIITNKMSTLSEEAEEMTEEGNGFIYHLNILPQSSFRLIYRRLICGETFICTVSSIKSDLSQLRIGNHGDSIILRLLRSWEIYNHKSEGERICRSAGCYYGYIKWYSDKGICIGCLTV